MFRLIRNACKAFAWRGDEKCGGYASFRVYIQPFLTGNRFVSVPLQPFKGHRFNILFQSAANIYYLHPQTVEFLNKSDIENKKLLKSVHANFQVSFYVAGLKALGLISKMIITPIWTLLESKDISIEEISQHYLQLSSYHADANQNVIEFMKGDFPAFTNRYLENDQIYEFL